MLKDQKAFSKFHDPFLNIAINGSETERYHLNLLKKRACSK